MKKRYLILMMVGMAKLATAQTAATGQPSLLPPPPWLGRIPDMSHFTITYANAGDQAADAGASPSTPDVKNHPPKMLEVTKTGAVVLEQSTDSSGTVIQSWRKNGFFLQKASAKKDWFVGPAATTSDIFQQADYSTVDFSGFSWITADNFVGIQEIKGVKCLVFKDQVVTLSQLDKADVMAKAAADFLHERLTNPNFVVPTGPTVFNWDKYKIDAEADIDFQTRLPVSLKLGPTSRTYLYLPPPTAELQIPGDAQLALDDLQKKTTAFQNMSAGHP